MTQYGHFDPFTGVLQEFLMGEIEMAAVHWKVRRWFGSIFRWHPNNHIHAFGCMHHLMTVHQPITWVWSEDPHHCVPPIRYKNSVLNRKLGLSITLINFFQRKSFLTVIGLLSGVKVWLLFVHLIFLHMRLSGHARSLLWLVHKPFVTLNLGYPVFSTTKS